MYQRFSAAQNPDVAKKSALGFFVGDVLFYFAVAFLASAAAFLLPTIEADTAVLRLAADTLPVALGAILLMASTAFIIPTGNSACCLRPETLYTTFTDRSPGVQQTIDTTYY